MLESRLEDVVRNQTYPVDIRKKLAAYLVMLKNGVLPPISRIYALLEELRETEGCANLQPDGSCAWLAKHAEAEGLRTPLPGEKVYCKRAGNNAVKASFLGCEGYLEINLADL